ncbi:hypothetical protein QBC37DRAFT_27922 [Rhypophila decipiens]|uniref:Zn(2)-C6 fungal-type domain-containing protein n=1 Tax=Rhypophila decipiens TaxID=261697 RepID=A0AAN6Y3S6_9PEZI|nr:hypothetical protein QBC37DRAFT_27922 [Rhypophila decipiens]
MPDGARQSRQLPGNACDECRRRKLRCDRKRPRCGACGSTPSVPCDITEERVPRGPKKGSISAIRNRIVALEKRLNTSDPHTRGSSRENDPNTSYTYQGDLPSTGYMTSSGQTSQDLGYAWGDPGPAWANEHAQVYDPTYDMTQTHEEYAYTYPAVTSPVITSSESTQYYTTTGATDWGQGQASAYGNTPWDGYSTQQ